MLLSREKLHGNYDDIIGESTAHLKVLKRIDRFAKSSKVVLISGETGTGKELVARALHAESRYAMHPMVVVNCAGIAENLIEMEATLQEIEKSAILATLARENGNRSKTAAVLGISRVTLHTKLRTYSGEA